MMTEYEKLYSEYLERSIKAEKEKIELVMKVKGKKAASMNQFNIRRSLPPTRLEQLSRLLKENYLVKKLKQKSRGRIIKTMSLIGLGLFIVIILASLEWLLPQ